MDAIRCENLSKQYDQIIALESLNLTVPAGSVFGFLGRNGAGKTTTIRLLTGLAQPTAGSAWVAGVEMTNGDSRGRGQFGYLPQDPTFYNWMTPVEYLDYVARLFEMDGPTRQRRIAEMIELVGLKGAAKRRIGGFSGGMHQRLGIAQAMLHQPPVLLLDEPTSALDPAGRYEVLELIDQLRGRVTVFLSSHILADIERVCDRVAIIHQGKLLLVAERDELLARYATNVLALELARESSERVGAFAAALQTQPWCAGLTQEGASLNVSVHDLPLAKEAILPLIVEHHLSLNRYEWIRPTLEEIFLKLSA